MLGPKGRFNLGLVNLVIARHQSAGKMTAKCRDKILTSLLVVIGGGQHRVLFEEGHGVNSRADNRPYEGQAELNAPSHFAANRAKR